MGEMGRPSVVFFDDAISSSLYGHPRIWVVPRARRKFLVTRVDDLRSLNTWYNTAGWHGTACTKVAHSARVTGGHDFFEGLFDVFDLTRFACRSTVSWKSQAGPFYAGFFDVSTVPVIYHTFRTWHLSIFMYGMVVLRYEEHIGNGSKTGLFDRYVRSIDDLILYFVCFVHITVHEAVLLCEYERFLREWVTGTILSGVSWSWDIIYAGISGWYGTCCTVNARAGVMGVRSVVSTRWYVSVYIIRTCLMYHALAKLSFNHSNCRTHSWRFSTFYRIWYCTGTASWTG